MHSERPGKLPTLAMQLQQSSSFRPGQTKIVEVQGRSFCALLLHVCAIPMLFHIIIIIIVHLQLMLDGV